MTDTRTEYANADKKLIMVLELPSSVSAGEIETALNAPYDDGYYLLSILGEQSGSIRAVYKLRVQQNEKNDAAAFIRANPRMAVPQVIAGLAALGITRSREWVKRQQADVLASIHS